jgi:hypothetical protein
MNANPLHPRRWRGPLIILLLLAFGTACGQAKRGISIRHKKEKYYLTKTCHDFLAWEEVRIRDKAINEAINGAIREAVRAYKLPPDAAASRCGETMEYSTEFKVSYAKHGLISYYLSAFTYFKGSPHGYREFSTLNFDAATGKQIRFHDFIDSGSVAAVDTLIMRRLEERLRDFTSDMDSWRQQLPALAFTIKDQGIDVLFRSNIYVLSIIEIPLSYEELRPFINKEGLLAAVYESKG